MDSRDFSLASLSDYLQFVERVGPPDLSMVSHAALIVWLYRCFGIGFKACGGIGFWNVIVADVLHWSDCRDCSDCSSQGEV